MMEVESKEGIEDLMRFHPGANRRVHHPPEREELVQQRMQDAVYRQK